MEVNIDEEISKFKKVMEEMTNHTFDDIIPEVICWNCYSYELHLKYKDDDPNRLTTDVIKCNGGMMNIIRIKGGMKYYEWKSENNKKF